MSLDITIKERKEFYCPDCGRLVTAQDIGEEYSGGRVRYDFLEPIGCYVPYEKRTDENDWYGLDMALDEKQAKQLAQFVSVYMPSNYNEIEGLVARALMLRIVFSNDENNPVGHNLSPGVFAQAPLVSTIRVSDEHGAKIYCFGLLFVLECNLG